MGKDLEISHYILETKVLGPFSRSALWVRGCCFHCEGCLAEEMNRLEPVRKAPQELAALFSGLRETEGITISGGEPFLQPEALCDMIDAIRRERDYGVIAYSGFTLEELREKRKPGTGELLERLDLLIDGRYQRELDDGKPFRGSSNQRLILLTDRYKEVYEDYYFRQEKRSIEIRVERDRVYLVGVPSAQGLQTWKDLKKRAEANADGI